MRVSNLIEFISGAHISKYVTGPFNQRGAIMLVASPGHLKSTIIKESLVNYPDVLLLSDLNVQQVGMLKDSLAGGRYSTLGFGEFEKLYERNPATAQNLEGVLRAMVEEGYDKMSFQSQEMIGTKARVFLVGGITPYSYAKRFQFWLNSGFARRFIWLHYRLDNPEAITEAIREWKKLDFGKVNCNIPANKEIPYKLTKNDGMWLEMLLQHQPSKETSYALLKKTFVALVWRHSHKVARQIISDVAPAMSRDGANLII